MKSAHRLRWSFEDTDFQSDLINKELRVSPWSGHRQFAYDLVKATSPKRIVELGTHYGCSFFSFCQSVKDNKLDTELIAIDTWKGDEHAGFYGKEVLSIVSKTVARHFSELNIKLWKTTFSNANEHTPDNSINLLHIDGYHSFSAVKNDFETWLPKVANNGIVIFHDVAQKNGYESAEYWAEIKSFYPHFEFKHSFGLGILFPKGDYYYQKLLDVGIEQIIDIYTYKALSKLYKIQVSDQARLVDERQELIDSMELSINERDTILDKRLHKLANLIYATISKFTRVSRQK